MFVNEYLLFLRASTVTTLAEIATFLVAAPMLKLDADTDNGTCVCGN